MPPKEQSPTLKSHHIGGDWALKMDEKDGENGYILNCLKDVACFLWIDNLEGLIGGRVERNWPAEMSCFFKVLCVGSFQPLNGFSSNSDLWNV